MESNKNMSFLTLRAGSAAGYTTRGLHHSIIRGHSIWDQAQMAWV